MDEETVDVEVETVDVDRFVEDGVERLVVKIGFLVDGIDVDFFVDGTVVEVDFRVDVDEVTVEVDFFVDGVDVEVDRLVIGRLVDVERFVDEDDDADVDGDADAVDFVEGTEDDFVDDELDC